MPASIAVLPPKHGLNELACRMREFASWSQQIPPALLACHGDVQSFQMLFHLLPTLLHGVFAKKSRTSASSSGVTSPMIPSHIRGIELSG